MGSHYTHSWKLQCTSVNKNSLNLLKCCNCVDLLFWMLLIICFSSFSGKLKTLLSGKTHEARLPFIYFAIIHKHTSKYAYIITNEEVVNIICHKSLILLLFKLIITSTIVFFLSITITKHFGIETNFLISYLFRCTLDRCYKVRYIRESRNFCFNVSYCPWVRTYWRVIVMEAPRSGDTEAQK